jgi:D-serine deaminase-like pyridoxal phosphate-dependent protein
VLLKLETGANRYGVLPGEPALNLARQLVRLSGIEFKGIYTHETGREPTPEGIDREAFEVATVAVETALLLKKEGIPAEHVSVGASATYRASCRLIKEGKFPEITEIHPGSGIVGDLKGVSVLALPEDSCTLSVLVTVMSTSHSSHAVIDAGFKTFGADSLINLRDKAGFFWEGKPRFGAVRGRPDLWLGALHAETGRIFYKDTANKLNPGDRLEIIPNNATLVINLHDQLYGVRNGSVEQVIPVTGRGRGS